MAIPSGVYAKCVSPHMKWCGDKCNGDAENSLEKKISNKYVCNASRRGGGVID